MGLRLSLFKTLLWSLKMCACQHSSGKGNRLIYMYLICHMIYANDEIVIHAIHGASLPEAGNQLGEE